MGEPTPSPQPQIMIPDFVVRQIGAQQLQLAAAQEEIRGLTGQLAAANAEIARLKEPSA
jgi:hypothetical protein